jgi:hypothetical protein
MHTSERYSATGTVVLEFSTTSTWGAVTALSDHNRDAVLHGVLSEVLRRVARGLPGRIRRGQAPAGTGSAIKFATSCWTSVAASTDGSTAARRASTALLP